MIAGFLQGLVLEPHAGMEVFEGYLTIHENPRTKTHKQC